MSPLVTRYRRGAEWLRARRWRMLSGRGATRLPGPLLRFRGLSSEWRSVSPPTAYRSTSGIVGRPKSGFMGSSVRRDGGRLWPVGMVDSADAASPRCVLGSGHFGLDEHRYPCSPTSFDGRPNSTTVARLSRRRGPRRFGNPIGFRRGRLRLRRGPALASVPPGPTSGQVARCAQRASCRRRLTHSTVNVTTGTITSGPARCNINATSALAHGSSSASISQPAAPISSGSPARWA